MVELARLAKFAGPVFHEVLTDRFVGSNGEHGFGRIDRLFHTAPALNIRRMLILARASIFTSSCPKKVAAVLHRFPAPGLRKGGLDRHSGVQGSSLTPVETSAMFFSDMPSYCSATHTPNDTSPRKNFKGQRSLQAYFLLVDLNSK